MHRVIKTIAISAITILSVFSLFASPADDMVEAPEPAIEDSLGMQDGRSNFEKHYEDTSLDYDNIPQSENVNDEYDFRVALKTNLLFDVVGAPNIGVEVPLKRNFSITADFAWAGWQIKNLYALQTLQGGVGAKYWFDKAFEGWNVGLYGVYSNRYDVQWKDGYQGDGFLSAGVSGGYAFSLGGRLRMEASLAAGYFYTPEVRHYHRAEEGHLMWQETRYNVSRFSLTKVQLNLVWLIGKSDNERIK